MSHLGCGRIDRWYILPKLCHNVNLLLDAETPIVCAFAKRHADFLGVDGLAG